MFYLWRTHTGIERNPLLEKNIYKRQVCLRVPLITGWTVSTEKIKPELLTYRCGRFVRKTGGCAFRVDSPTSYQGVNPILDGVRAHPILDGGRLKSPPC